MSIMLHDENALSVPQKSYVRSKEDELLLEKLERFRKETEKQKNQRTTAYTEKISRYEVEKYFLPLCERNFSVTKEQLKTLDTKEISRLCEILVKRTSLLARFQLVCGSFLFVGPIIAAISLAFLVHPIFVISMLLSIFSIPTLSLCKSICYRREYLNLAKIHGGNENIPFEFLVEKLQKDEKNDLK